MKINIKPLFKSLALLVSLSGVCFLLSCKKDDGFINSAPSISDQSFSIDENSAEGTVVGNVQASDEDEGQVLTFSILSGNSGNTFVISSTGELSVNMVEELDFEKNETFELVVQVEDDLEEMSEATISIALNDINETHTVDDQVFSIEEHADVGSIVGILEVEDQDTESNYSFSILNGNDNGIFMINTSGEISTSSLCDLDFETQSEFVLEVSVYDNDFNVEVSITIEVSDIQFSTEGLVGYYPFNGNANDHSSNLFDGTVSGATLTQDRFGCENSAYYFDGVNDYILLGSDFDYSQVSFSFWFKPESISTNGVVMLSSDHSTKSNGLFSIVVDEVEGLDYLKYIRNELNGESNIVEISEDEWHFAALVIDGLDFTYYLDGNLIDSKTSAGNISSANGTTSATLGCTRLIDRFFTGYLDDVRVYNRILTTSEITELYTSKE